MRPPPPHNSSATALERPIRPLHHNSGISALFLSFLRIKGVVLLSLDMMDAHGIKEHVVTTTFQQLEANTEKCLIFIKIMRKNL